MNKPGRIIYFDLMRSFCAIWIVGLWHMPNYMAPELSAKFTTGIGWQTTYCVLAAFAFISGFFGANNQMNTWKDVLLYYKKRMLRIYPLYAIAAVALILCQYGSWTSLPGYLLGVGCFIEPYPTTIWFVSMLLIFYFITPLLLKCSTKIKIVIFALLEMAFLILAYRMGSDIRLAYYWPFYVMGLICRRKNLHLLFFERRGTWIFTAAAGLGYVLLGMKTGNDFKFITVICCLLFIYFALNIFERLSDLTGKSRVLAFLGYSSMGAYLFHRPFFYIIKATAGDYDPVAAFLIYLPCAFILGGVIQTIYDKLIIKNRGKVGVF